MKQYNIYAGLEGKFGGAFYQYTTIANSLEAAKHEAWEVACEEFESMEGSHGLHSKKDYIEEYCLNNDLNCNDLDKEDLVAIVESYLEERNRWICFDAVLTEEDDIDKEDLILSYIVEDDSSSQTDSE